MTDFRKANILLVDDDAALCLGVGWMIRFLGHEVHVAHSGFEALERVEQGLDVNLVLLDVDMPVMGGEETLRRLLLLRPEQAVVMVSGFTDERIERLKANWPQVAFLAKPFDRDQLADVVCQRARFSDEPAGN